MFGSACDPIRCDPEDRVITGCSFYLVIYLFGFFFVCSGFNSSPRLTGFKENQIHEQRRRLMVSKRCHLIKTQPFCTVLVFCVCILNDFR